MDYVCDGFLGCLRRVLEELKDLLEEVE